VLSSDLCCLQCRTLNGDKLEQVARRRPISSNRMHGRSQNLLMMIEPPPLQLVNPHGLKTERRRYVDLKLRIDLCRHLASCVTIGTNAGTPPSPVFLVG
jgi:hypothetical protein